MLREFQEEIARLKAQLESGGGGSGINDASSSRRRKNRLNRDDADDAALRADRRLDSIREAMRVEMEANARLNLEKEEAEKAQEVAREHARAQMREIMEARGRTEEERAELEDAFRAQQAEMEEHFAALVAEKEEHRVLQERLELMEAKVVKGGTNLLDQEQRLVEEARIREEKMRKMESFAEEQARRIRELEDLDSIAGETYKNVDDEIESKTNKIERLKQAYRRCAVDIKDLDDEFLKERDELLEQVRALTRRIKLKNLILDFCVPPEWLAEISERCRWDDGDRRWVLEHAACAGNAARARREQEARERALLESEGDVHGGGTDPGRRADDDGSEKDETRSAARMTKTTPLPLATRRLVSAIADVTGDFERAREMAARSEAEKMLSAYLTYDEVKARKRATSAGARRGDGGDDAFFPDGQSGKNADAAATSATARAASRRARPGTARNPRRGRDEGVDALAVRESDSARFPVARGLVKPR
jgi:kinesin family protein 3/17